MRHHTSPVEAQQPDDQAEEETGAVALLQQRDSVHALTEGAMTRLLAEFLLGAPDVDGIRIVEAQPSAQSVQIEVVDRYGEGRTFLLPTGRWRMRN